MATYKVLQDIEAEDKFLGPLTLKQFILACIALVSGYLCFWFLSKDLWILTIPLLPVILFSGFLAFPWGRDQPTEVWLLAKVRFMLKPRRRIWDQTGMQELVTITAPKKIGEQFTSNNLSQTEVKSRLKALADTIDSRGWAVKNVNVNMYAQPGYGSTLDQTDRLVDASKLTREVPTVDIQAADDILDERNNPTAQHLNQMITSSEQNHRQETLQTMQDIRDHKKPAKHSSHQKHDGPADYWFMNQPAPGKLPKDYAVFGSQTVAPGTTDDNSQSSSSPLTDEEQKLLDKTHQQQDQTPVAYGQTAVLQPIHDKHGKHKSHTKTKHKAKPEKPAHSSLKQAMTQTPDPAILNLAKDDNLSVATLAREANKKHEPDVPGGEVIVPLH